MTAIPREAQQVINARAYDALKAFMRAIDVNDRQAAREALRDLSMAFDDAEALAQEHVA